MSDDRRPYSADEKEAFGYVDDEERTEQPLEEEILEAEDYRGVTRHGTTPAEERTGVPLDEALEEERPEEPDEEVSEEGRDDADPQAGALVDSWDVFAEETEAPPEDPEQEAVRETEDDRARAARLRESGEAGPPPDPTGGRR
ncbi:hypothetical protein [Glycomyces xiaoerkulensis]|uniref:hypothetical protein n=1 Tax=Glycomyces xiaoerkulensis TaxID=2038139 RepID=UPI000C25AB39|nr:hypothetical protein [Glycomyces xiaoerkulensis]